MGPAPQAEQAEISASSLCVMAVNYQNLVRLEFTARRDGLEAVLANFPEVALKAGQPHRSKFVVPPSYSLALAGKVLGQHSIVYKIEGKDPGLLAALWDGEMLFLEAENGQIYPLSLRGIRQAITRLEKCTKEEPRAAVQDAKLSDLADFVDSVDSADSPEPEEISEQPVAEAAPESAPQTPVPAVSEEETPEQIFEPAPLPDLPGKAEPVDLVKEEPGKEAEPAPLFVPAIPAPEISAPPEEKPEEKEAQSNMPLQPELSDKTEGAAEIRSQRGLTGAWLWHVRKGVSLEEILGKWSGIAGAGFVWDVPGEYDVLEDLSVYTTYVRAVEALLEQYRRRNINLTGRLHVDPKTGARVLVLREDPPLPVPG